MIQHVLTATYEYTLLECTVYCIIIPWLQRPAVRMPCPMPHWRQGLLWRHYSPQPCSPTHQQWKHTHGTQDGRHCSHWGWAQVWWEKSAIYCMSYDYVVMIEKYTNMTLLQYMLCTLLYTHALPVGWWICLLDFAHYIVQGLQQLPLHALYHCWPEEGMQTYVLPLLEHMEHPAPLLLKAESPAYKCGVLLQS